MLPSLNEMIATKRWKEADILTLKDRYSFELGVPTLPARIKYFVWYCHFLGYCDEGEFIGRQYYRLISQSLGTRWVRGYTPPRRGKQVIVFDVLCDDCGYSGKEDRFQRKMDVVCARCEGIHVRFL